MPNHHDETKKDHDDLEKEIAVIQLLSLLAEGEQSAHQQGWLTTKEAFSGLLD